MHHDFIDRYSRLASPVHRLPEGLKAVVAFVMIFFVVLSPGTWIYFYLTIGVILVVVSAVSTIPPGFLARRILFFEPFVIVIAGLAALQPAGTAKFFVIVVKSTLSLLTILLLANTTPFHKLIDVSRRLRFPSVMVTILALMYRYLFVLIDEVERIGRARHSRTFVRTRARSWIILGSVLGQLFVRSTERAERIYAAMCARGWKG